MEPTTFAELGLSAKVLDAVTASGYTTPTPIQAQAVPVAMTGRDVLGIAQTGTGKTAAFVMPMISRLESGRARARMPRSLILLPTRELATQVAQSFEKYGRNHKLAVALLIGGVSMDDQVAKLDRGADVLIATPGRLLDHFGRGRIMLMGVEILVIDEADRMLDMGFIPDIEKICKLLPPRRQTLFFSATMPAEITRLVDQFLNEPTRIEVAKPATTAKTITQSFLFCRDGEDYAKREALREMIRAENVKNAIIFCNRKRDVAILHKSLVKHGFNAGALHGDMDQSSRTATLDKFRAGEITILAASDVAARGLDIPEVSHVFNFDVPWQADDYVHRIGRTGRAGRQGFSATLVTWDDFKAIKDIEKLIGEAPSWLGEPPTEEELADGAARKRGRGKARGKSSDARGSEKRGGEARSERGRVAGRPERAPRPARGPRPEPVLGASDAPMLAEQIGEAIVGADGLAVSAPSEDNRERSRNRRRRSRGGQPRTADGMAQQPTVEAGFETGAEQPHIAVEAAAGDSQPAAERQPRQERPRRGGRQDQPREGRAPQEGREPREAREPREPRRDARPRNAETRNAETQGDRGDRAPADRQSPRQPQRERADRNQDRNQDRGGQERGQDGGRIGFADNIPAFLRKPVRASN